MKRIFNGSGGRKTALILSLCLIFALAVGTTFALLKANTDPVENTFTAAKSGTDIVEKLDGNQKKSIVVKNTGTAVSYVRVKLVMNWVDENGNVSAEPVNITPSITDNWFEQGGIYCVANLRGGSEYGEAWYKAGMLENKQNVFDDFIAAAEYLIAEKYTSTDKLAIHGGSNGGLLVGACEVQRPDLYAVCLPAVGVMDMLRYHKFTIGWGWAVEYGSSENEEQFSYIYKYSPLHNIKEGVKYPATLVTTADHDDRVVPAHSFKFTAQMQHCQAGDAPILIRIESKAGHGAGKPTSKRIDEEADTYAFLFQNIGVPYKPVAK